MAKIAANLRPSADGSAAAHILWSLVAKLQAASQRAYNLSSCAMGQTDGRADRRTDRAIQKCLHIGRGHTKAIVDIRLSPGPARPPGGPL